MQSVQRNIFLRIYVYKKVTALSFIDRYNVLSHSLTFFNVCYSYCSTSVHYFAAGSRQTTAAGCRRRALERARSDGGTAAAGLQLPGAHGDGCGGEGGQGDAGDEEGGGGSWAGAECMLRRRQTRRRAVALLLR